MTLQLLKGDVYDADGNLLQWYEGYGDLENESDLLEYRSPCVGFVSSKSLNTEAYKFDFITNTVIEK